MEVDTVIATHELIELFEKMKVNLNSLDLQKEDSEMSDCTSKLEE